eukprot:TRINITY_DN8482_c0_g2_i2.p2 TRINITY_DN8482_c0_g2~~TRINITY_DN8482_c0_g2_i2.p2  ORF type:complete len:196 (-),score=61.83 TRINITY_DN8482_c0_g2_i2:154-741(-)
MATAQQKGDRFEKRMERMFKRLGKWNVRRNVTLIDSFGNRSQIDLTYGLFRKTYVECKNYALPVPLKDVAKFKEVLALNRIPLSRGLFVTTSTYVPRATTIGVLCLDGNDLRILERRAKISGFSRFAAFALASGTLLYALGLFDDGLPNSTQVTDRRYWDRKLAVAQMRASRWYDIARTTAGRWYADARNAVGLR